MTFPRVQISSLEFLVKNSRDHCLSRRMDPQGVFPRVSSRETCSLGFFACSLEYLAIGKPVNSSSEWGFFCSHVVFLKVIAIISHHGQIHTKCDCAYILVVNCWWSMGSSVCYIYPRMWCKIWKDGGWHFIHRSSILMSGTMNAELSLLFLIKSMTCFTQDFAVNMLFFPP